MASKEINYKDHTFTISYELVNPKEKKSILILHGWGSNKEIMRQAFGKSMPEYRHIYIDMPGFGKSSNEIVLETQDYADIIRVFLDSIRADIDIAMGHSFGGKIATLLKPKLLVLLSSAGIYRTKSIKIKLKIAIFKLLKLFALTKLRSYFVAEDAKSLSQPMYETFKNVVDEDFSSIFANFENKTLICWGKDDTATPLDSGEKIHSLIKNSNFYPYDGDHYFFMKHSQDISKHIDKTF